MTKDVIFWAQALDNVSPDHIAVNGETLSEADTARRQNAVSAVSQVALSSLATVDCGDVRVSVGKHRFVVESSVSGRQGQTARSSEEFD